MATASPGYRLNTALYCTVEGAEYLVQYSPVQYSVHYRTVQFSRIVCTVHYSSGLCSAQWEPCFSPAVTKLPFTQVITRTFITIYKDFLGFPGISWNFQGFPWIFQDFLGFPHNRCGMTGKFLTACFRISVRAGEDLWWQWRLISTARGFWHLEYIYTGIYLHWNISTLEYTLHWNILYTIIYTSL